ncbi:MAG: hypothetical protein IJE52_03855 [Bacteroidales bacterium]|nr:hypothetical protein [Bacteroidales bacterium]
MVNTVINALVAFLIGGATLSFNFSAVDAAGNSQYEGSGSVITLGENYRMETDEILVVSNGSVKGIYQKGIDEIVLLPVAPSSGADAAAPGADIMDNPFALLRNPGGMYDISTMGMDAEGIPMQIVMKAKTGAVYTISIQKYSKFPAPDASLFTLNPDDYPSAVVTDLR